MLWANSLMNAPAVCMRGEMTNRDPDQRYERPEQVLPWLIEQWVRHNVNTCLPGMVDSYDPTTKRARIQLALETRIAGLPALQDGTPAVQERLEKKPLLLNVPLRQTSTGNHMMHHQIDKDDVVLVMFSQRGIDRFKQNWGEISAPDRGMFFNYRDAFAIPWGDENIQPVSDQGVTIQSRDRDTFFHLVDNRIRLVAGNASIEIVPGRITLRVAGTTINLTPSNIDADSDRIDLN